MKKKKKKASRARRVRSADKASMIETFVEALISEDDVEGNDLCSSVRDTLRRAAAIVSGRTTAASKIEHGQIWEINGERFRIYRDVDETLALLSLKTWRETTDSPNDILRKCRTGKLVEEA